MRLTDVIGQGSIARLIARLIAKGRLPHALLLEGVPGSGRRTLATAIAQAVLCAAPVAGDACGACASCRMVMAGSHPDLVTTLHDTAPGTVSVELIRDEVVEAAYSSPLVGERRVFLLPGIERWNLASANAMLKVLEEPPAAVRFIATTIQAAGVLRTIRSRCQLYRLQPLAVDEVAQILLRGGISAAEAQHRALAGQGGHRGLWQGAITIPLEPLLRLAREGYRTEWVAEVVAALPTSIVDSDEAAGLTLEGSKRRLVRVWLGALAQALRPDLRLEGALGVQAAERIQRINALHQDLLRNIQPRLVIESIGLGELERALRRSAT